MNMTRHAVSCGRYENRAANSSTAPAQPTDQALCTVPITLPRCCARMVSAINTAPAAHSPPKPNPCSAFSISNCWKDWENALKNVNTENHKIVICKIRTRPYLSDAAPATHPPMADAISVTPLISPASPLLRLKAAISAGIARLNICTSSASSAQPLKHAQKVLRSLPEICLYQVNMIFLLSHSRQAALFMLSHVTRLAYAFFELICVPVPASRFW